MYNRSFEQWYAEQNRVEYTADAKEAKAFVKRAFEAGVRLERASQAIGKIAR